MIAAAVLHDQDLPVLSAAFVLASIACAVVFVGWTPARLGTVWVGIALVVLLVVGRLPSVFVPGALNPDESLMLAQAMKFAINPIPWYSIDTTTSGPINSYVLLPLHWLGLPYGYPLARITGTCLITAFVVLTFLAQSRLGGLRAASIAALPVCCFFAFATENDFLSYSSELGPLAGTALLTLLVARLPATPASARQDARRAFAAGLCIFLISMTKLQGMPLAITLFVILLTLVSPTRSLWRRRVTFAVAGAGAGTAALLLILAFAGVLYDFYVSFLLMPFEYAAHPLSPRELWQWLWQGETMPFAYVGASSVLLALAALLALFHRAGIASARIAAARTLGAAVLIVVLLWTLAQAGRPYHHYKNFIALGTVWSLFLLLPWQSDEVPGEPPIRRAFRWGAMAILAVASVAASGWLLVKRNSLNWDSAPQVPYSDSQADHWLYRALSQVATPRERLGIWGFAGQIWVYSGLIPATRETLSNYALDNMGPDDYYRKRFLKALRDDPPPFMVEAVGPSQFAFTDRSTRGIDSIPNLRGLFEDRYVRVFDDDNVGFWMRRDVVDACCILADMQALQAAASPYRDVEHKSPYASEQGWVVSKVAAGGGPSSFPVITVPDGVWRVAVPFMAGPDGDRSGLHIGVDNSPNACDQRIQAVYPYSMDLCILEVKGSQTIELTDNNHGGAWLAVGRPLLVRDNAQR